MNKFIGMGNLVRDPELRKTQSDVSVCTFTIACNRRFKNAEGKSEADFLNIVTWRGLADNCYRYLKKGSRVCVSGMVQTRNYEDASGNKRTAVEIVADDVEFINVHGKENQSADPFLTDMTPADGDDLPF